MSSITNLKSAPQTLLVRLLFLVIMLVLIVSLSVAQARAKANTFTTNFRTELSMTRFVPCAAKGAGEDVQFSGPLNIVFVTTLDNKGGFSTKYELEPKAVRGTGLSTGTKYHGIGVSHGDSHGTIGVTSSFEDSFKVSGQGGSFLVRVDARFNVTPTGEVILVLNDFNITCKSAGYPSYP